MAPNSAVPFHPSVPLHFDFLLDLVPEEWDLDYPSPFHLDPPLSEKWGLDPFLAKTLTVLVDRADNAAQRLRTLAEIPSDGYIVGSNTLHLEDGEWVYACTRGCNLSFRNHVCFHGIPFINRCTEGCAKCRVPHRETKVNLSTELQPSIKGGSCFSTQRGNPWKTRCVRADAFTYQRWEKELKEKPWSDELQRGRDQSMRHLKWISNPTVIVPVASNDEPADVERPLGRNGVSEEHELNRLGFGGSKERMSFKPPRIIPREVPEWMNNKTFVRGVIDGMYPHPHQNRKRHTLHWLADAYYRRMEDAATLCETLGLSQKGLESKLDRFKSKAEKAAVTLSIS